MEYSIRSTASSDFVTEDLTVSHLLSPDTGICGNHGVSLALKWIPRADDKLVRGGRQGDIAPALMFPTEGNVIATVRVADKMEEENTRYIRTYED